MARVSLLGGFFCSMLILIMSLDFTHNFNMPSTHRVFRRSASINYTKIVNFWENHKNEFVLDSDHTEVVLIIGNTGSGKTTLTSALTGRKLTATMPKGQAYLVIVDEEGKIGQGTSSKTLIPEIMTDGKRNVTYVDCSGFHDNRDVEYEISSIYFQNILMNQIKKIKLILVINHDSLKINGNKNDFDELFEHVGNFIKNISKFHAGIALVVTKVENIYEDADDGSRLLLNDNQSVLDGIANYLEKKKETYRKKMENREKYQMYVDLIDVLLQRENNSITRIALFRQPTRRGLLKNLPKTKDEVDAIAKMIIEKVQYVEGTKDDYGFALPQSLKNIVDQIVDDIFRNALIDRLYEIGNETLLHYSQMEQQFSDIGILRERISHAYNAISGMKNVDGFLELFQELLNVVNTLNIPVSLTNLNTISKEIKRLYFFTSVSNSNGDLHMLFLKSGRQNIINSINHLKNFYDFLDNLQENLSLYNSQRLKDDSRIANIITSCAHLTYATVQNIKDLKKIVQEMSSDEIYEKIKTFKLNRFQLKHLTAVFTAFTRKIEFSCTSPPEQMIVKGYNVRMSDVVKTDCWAKVKVIKVFAVNKIFIDYTINKTGAEAQLFIIAPTWEIIGGPKIILDGKAGESHKEKSAKLSSSNYENGSNGLPGLPGGPAGHFFGIGEKFINSEYLEIHANGGEGGPGQHGGNGADGIVGGELSKSFFEIDQSFYNVEMYFEEHNLVYHWVMHAIDPFVDFNGQQNARDYERIVEVLGQPAKRPSVGGDGGSSGKGGYPGKIVINGLGESIDVITSNNSGSNGMEGRGGHGGKGTSDGRKVKFYCKTTFTGTQGFHDLTWINGEKIPAGKDGEPGSNESDRKCPAKLTISRPYQIINSFKDFLMMELFENIKESKLRTFIYEIENDNKINTEYKTLAFVEEFKGLENQFLELRNKIDFVPFYDSFLSRVEEYAKSENILENKKVLSYIYTAALTKLFTLNKKRKNQAVVNLPKYLDTIEMNVKEIDNSYHLQIVQKYQDNYRNSLNKKIQEANNFIQNTIEPEIDKLLDESDTQIDAIVNEINDHRNATKNAIETLEKKRAKIGNIMQLRAALLPLKLAATSLSFFGPIGAGVGVAVTSVSSIAEGVLLDKTSSLGENKIYSLDPNLKLISRVTEVVNNKYQLASGKLSAAMKKLEEYEKELSLSHQTTKKRQIKTLKTQLQEATFRKANGVSESIQRLKDIEQITGKIATFTNSEKDILEKKKEEEKKVTDLTTEKKYEKRLRLLNNVQSILNSAEIVFTFSRRIANDEGMIKNINNQISEYVQQLKVLEKMESQVYDIISPDLRQIEKTINAVKSSVNGSSHAKLDLTKWTVRTTLRDIKSLLQKFTRKMSFELQSNLIRYTEKIDEGFSILIDIYDRIDSYSDSAKQAGYIAHIESASMDDVRVADVELSRAVNDLKLIIHSNILTEKYEIASHAFKQHFFPFAANVLRRFQLPTGMRLNDTETLRSNIIAKIKEMKNHIDESEATIGEYSKYVHREKEFNSNTTGSSPFYVWKHDTVKDEIQRLLNGSEITIKADISRGLFYNSIKYNDIGIYLKLNNEALQSSFTSVLKNFRLTMTMIGNNYYRCGERYHFISFDDDITISYILNQDEQKNWIDPNEVCTLIHNSHTFLSPYGMWSIKLQGVNKSVPFDQLSVFANESIDLELIGRGYYIEQDADFNFDICNEYLDTYYTVENIVKEL